MQIIKYILYVYFTPFSYFIYKYATDLGNLGISGIGLGLIHSQRIFWIANIIIFTSLYLYYINLYYINLLLFITSGYLYILSLSKTIYFIRLLDNSSKIL